MRYLPLTPQEKQQMLDQIGINSIEELFRSIPGTSRTKGDIDTGEPLDEFTLIQELKEIADKNRTFQNLRGYIGAGCYNHYIPAAINHIISRTEFYTAYTPYQPEVSQGTLQALFEFQTLISRLFDMDVTNASMYDGASSLAEGILMARRITKREKIALSSLVHPEYQSTVTTYFSPDTVREIPYTETGESDLSRLETLLKDEDLGAVVIQYPNFFGTVEDLKTVRTLIDQYSPKTLMIVVVTEVLSLGILTPPGTFGADIVVGEGQSLGIPPALGGPGLGLFSCKEQYLRKMPGRIVGETTDRRGNRSYLFTLSTREQHIRRENATSNICSNHSLNAIAATIYLSLVGKQGFKEIAQANFHHTHYALRILSRFANINIKYGNRVFNEFVIQFDQTINGKTLYQKLKQRDILLGLPLNQFYPREHNCYLVNFTEQTTKKEIDDLVNIMIDIMGEADE